MTGDTYIYIDGGHLRKYHAEFAEKWFGTPAPDLDLNCIRQHLSAHKCFYYDCLDDIKRATESQADFDSRQSRQGDLFGKFRRATNSHVRLGALTGQGKKIRQKQVDILLAVDAMSHAARGNMRTAVLIAGDQDFTPLVEALVDLGLFVHVCGDPKHTSPTLADAADVFRPIEMTDYFNWTDETAKRTMPIPSRYVGGRPDNSPLTPATVGGYSAQRYFDNGVHFIAIDTPVAKRSGGGYALCITHPDESRLKLFCELEYGEVCWGPA